MAAHEAHRDRRGTALAALGGVRFASAVRDDRGVNGIDEGVSLFGGGPSAGVGVAGGASNTSRPARGIRHTPLACAAAGRARCDIRTRRAPTTLAPPVS